MKDAKGHGSDARGGSMNSSRYPDQNYDRFGKLRPNAPARARGITDKPGGSSIVARTGSSARGIMPTIPFREGGGQPVVSNASAAATLASGPKSAPVETHPAMAPIWTRSAGTAGINDALRSAVPSEAERVAYRKKMGMKP
jgi:hypothetical protein